MNDYMNEPANFPGGEHGPNAATTDYRQAALKLWMLLDDIDTLDDACRADDAAFRKHAREVQRKRFAILSGEQMDVLLAHGVTASQPVAWVNASALTHLPQPGGWAHANGERVTGAYEVPLYTHPPGVAPSEAPGWVRLKDSDWVNIVNHPEVLGHGSDSDLAVACAVRLTEARLRELNTHGVPAGGKAQP